MVATRLMRLPVTLDKFQQALHFFLRADADANHAGTDIFRTITKQNTCCLQFPAHFRAARTEIGQKEIPSARIGLYAEFVKLLFEPTSRPQDVFYVELHGLGISDGRFRSRQRGDVHWERGRRAAKDRERFGAGDNRAEAKAGESG